MRLSLDCVIEDIMRSRSNLAGRGERFLCVRYRGGAEWDGKETGMLRRVRSLDWLPGPLAEEERSRSRA